MSVGQYVVERWTCRCCAEWQHQCVNVERNHKATSNRRWTESIVCTLRVRIRTFQNESSKNYCQVENDCQDQTILYDESLSIYLFYFEKEKKVEIFYCCCCFLFILLDWQTSVCTHIIHTQVILYKFSHYDSNERILCSFFLNFLLLFHLNLDKCSLIDAMCHSLVASKERARAKENMRKGLRLLLLRSLIMLLF